jgi:hypothetical protein
MAGWVHRFCPPSSDNVRYVKPQFVADVADPQNRPAGGLT